MHASQISDIVGESFIFIGMILVCVQRRNSTNTSNNVNIIVHRFASNQSLYVVASATVTATPRAAHPSFDRPYVGPGCFFVPWGPSLSISA